MCVNLGNIPTWLISPAAALKGMGLKTGLEWMDPAYSIVAKTEKDREKEEKKKEKANNEAWRRYYASRDRSLNAGSVLSSNAGSPCERRQTTKERSDMCVWFVPIITAAVSLASAGASVVAANSWARAQNAQAESEARIQEHNAIIARDEASYAQGEAARAAVRKRREVNARVLRPFLKRAKVTARGPAIEAMRRALEKELGDL